MAYLLTVSGLRGVVGTDLTPSVALEYGASLVELFGADRIYIVGRDTRPHGPTFMDTVKSGITGAGGHVVDIGIVPTPTLLFNVRNWNDDVGGGIVITASHNPVEWNALKFVRPDGVFLFQDDVNQLKEIFERRSWTWQTWQSVGKIEVYGGAIDDHIDAITESGYVDVEKIAKMAPMVAIDAVNGANWFALPELVRRLGGNPIRLNCEPTGLFPHVPEPKKEHLKELDAILKSGVAELGLASDPDGDRLLIGLKGHGLLTEEHTIAIATWAILEREKGPVVVNLSTSMMVEDVANRFGVPVFRTKVGEANVVAGVFEHDAVIGGEGNGGVILPDVNPTRDSLVGTALILDLAAKGRLNEVVEQLPTYTMLKSKFRRADGFDPEKVLDMFPQATETSTIDGAYVRLDRAWIHMRPSNTEPVIRIYVEADSEIRARELLDQAHQALLKLGAIVE